MLDVGIRSVFVVAGSTASWTSGETIRPFQTAYVVFRVTDRCLGKRKGVVCTMSAGWERAITTRCIDRLGASS